MTSTAETTCESGARPPRIVRRSALSLEQIRADVAAHFGSNATFDIDREARQGQARSHTSLQLGNVEIDYFHAVGGVMSGVERASFDLAFATRGAFKVTRGGVEADARPQGAVVSLVGVGDQVRIETLPRTLTFSLRFSDGLLQKHGEAMLGEGFKLHADEPVCAVSSASRALMRNVGSIFVEFIELEKVGLGSLVTPAYEELLANLAIAALHPDHASSSDVPAASRKIVDRAKEIIIARAAETVTILDVAAELGVTMRTLQIEFRKHCECTPLQFLLERRLGLARERLLTPDFGGNVQYVAMSCGFMNMGKFSSRYRAVFGELPSETLARGRRR